MKDFKKNNKLLGILLTVPVAIATIVGCAFALLTFISPKTTIYVLERIYPQTISTPEIIYQTIIAPIEVTKIVSTTPLPYTTTPDNTSTASITPTETQTLTPANTSTLTNTPLPTPVILWHHKFEDGMPTDWRVLTESVAPSIVDGNLISPQTFQFAIGDSSWTDYIVRANFLSEALCTFGANVVAIRASSINKNMNARLCYEGVNLYADNSQIPGAGTTAGGVFEIRAEGNYYIYYDKKIYHEGYPNGYVIITLFGGVPLKEVEVIQLP